MTVSTTVSFVPDDLSGTISMSRPLSPAQILQPPTHLDSERCGSFGTRPTPEREAQSCPKNGSILRVFNWKSLQVQFGKEWQHYFGFEGRLRSRRELLSSPKATHAERPVFELRNKTTPERRSLHAAAVVLEGNGSQRCWSVGTWAVGNSGPSVTFCSCPMKTTHARNP